MSKIYERVILNQLCTYIEQRHLYKTTQSGFRKGHSTSTLLLKLRNDIRTAMSKSEITLAILIDNSKAFDTIDHGILLKKLHNLNFSRDSLEILSSYLSNRYQYVQIDDQKSSCQQMNFGVPQGSILGPVLFISMLLNSPIISPQSPYNTQMIPLSIDIAKSKILSSASKKWKIFLTNYSLGLELTIFFLTVRNFNL